MCYVSIFIRAGIVSLPEALVFFTIRTVLILKTVSLRAGVCNLVGENHNESERR